MNILLTLVTCLVLVQPTFAQTREQVLNQQLNKAMDVIESQDKLLNAQEAEIKAKNDLIDTQKLLIESLKASIETRDAQIAALSALKCDTSQVKFLFGIIKMTKKVCR